MAVPGLLLAHPVPDIPVFTSFSGDMVKVTIEIDPRSFTEDPENEAYTYHSVLRSYDDETKQELKEQGQDLVDRTIRFVFSPEKKVMPQFDFSFAGIEGKPLDASDDPVMLIGKAEFKMPDGASGYQVVADGTGRLSVIFKNEIDGETVERINVLFPGEESYLLDISGRKG